jgi:hypothetical protein
MPGESFVASALRESVGLVHVVLGNLSLFGEPWTPLASDSYNDTRRQRFGSDIEPGLFVTRRPSLPHDQEVERILAEIWTQARSDVPNGAVIRSLVLRVTLGGKTWVVPLKGTARHQLWAERRLRTDMPGAQIEWLVGPLSSGLDLLSSARELGDIEGYHEQVLYG